MASCAVSDHDLAVTGRRQAAREFSKIGDVQLAHRSFVVVSCQPAAFKVTDSCIAAHQLWRNIFVASRRECKEISLRGFCRSSLLWTKCSCLLFSTVERHSDFGRLLAMGSTPKSPPWLTSLFNLSWRWVPASLTLDAAKSMSLDGTASFPFWVRPGRRPSSPYSSVPTDCWQSIRRTM